MTPHVGDKNLNQDGVSDDQRFMPRTTLDYVAPRATDGRGPIRLFHLIGEPLNYGTNIINILQNNCYHELELEHEDLHDHI
jgi:hypothetical protein